MALKDNQIRFVAGDRKNQIYGQLTDDDGVAIAGTGYSVELHIGYDEPLVIPATWVDISTGVYTFAWDADSLVAGTYNYEIQITDPAGLPVTVNREQTTDKLLQIVIDAEIA